MTTSSITRAAFASLRQNLPAAALYLAGTALTAALAIQWAGYEPCELCLRQRLPYYLGLPALAAAIVVRRRRPGAHRTASVLEGTALAAFVLAFLLAAHHVGVEQGLWEGPVRCVSRTFDMSSLDAFAAQIGSTPMVSCNVPSFRILGFSLASWNMAVTLVVAGILGAGLLGRRILGNSK